MGIEYFTHLQCSSCHREHSSREVQNVCRDCGHALFAEYDLDAVRRRLSPDTFARRERSLWRYRELLPVFAESNIVTLGEGGTPLLRAVRTGTRLGVERLLIKEEGCNPTGSFKSRGMSIAVSKARELGLLDLCAPSAGNAGGALAAYAALAGMKSHIFVPYETPAVNIREVVLYGGDLHLVDGVISDAAGAMNAVRQGTRWFDMSTMKEPYRVEGKKTMGYELAEQCGWKLPDVIIYPTGGGTGLIGMWKAFRELEQLGWVGNPKPRMVSVQATGCAPIVKAFREKARSTEFWKGARTCASGLCVPKAFADSLILDIITTSEGTAVAISDEELLADMTTVAEEEGIFLCPEGAAAMSAVRHLVHDGFLRGSETVVVFNTGSGYKYTELFLR